MPSRFGLSRTEIKNSRTAICSTMVMVISVTLALIIELIIREPLGELSLSVQIFVATSIFVLLIFLSLQLREKRQ